MMGNEADANDACQEALMNLMRRIDRFDGRSKFSTWAYRVTTNACLDELRRRGRRPQAELPTHADGSPDERHLDNDRASSLEDRVQAAIDVDAALGDLAEDYRVCVVLRDICDLDYAEIADVLSIPPGTVRSRIARGRASLAKSLDAGNQAPPPERHTEQS